MVELLVVTGIIAMLIALLLPVLARARQSARKLQCESNLRSLGQVLVLHATDHQGYLPLAGTVAAGANGYVIDTPQSLGDPQELRYDYYDNGGGDYCVTALPAALAPYIINQPIRLDTWEDADADLQSPGPLRDAFTCPCDEITALGLYAPWRWISNQGSATYLCGWSSYGINEEVSGWADAGVTTVNDIYYPSVVMGHSRARGKISAIPNPSQTMFMCDTLQHIEMWVAGPNCSLGDLYTQQLPQSPGNAVFDLSRHQGTMNVLFVDGHVESLSILATGANSATGAVGTSGNSPSNELMSVSMDRDFR